MAKKPGQQTVVAEVSEIATPRQARAVLTTASIDDTGRVLSVNESGVTTFGRNDDCTYQFDDESVSGLHAQISVFGDSYILADHKSTNGTYLNDTRVHSPTVLRTGDRIRLGPRQILRFNLMDEEEQRALLRMYEAALLDGLTRVWNRKHMDERLDAELAFAVRHHTELAVLMLDVDHFKKVNDTYGHPAGDAVLVHVASLLRRALRTEDLVARYGGEEFVIAIRGASLAEASIVGERIRIAIETSRIEIPGHPPIAVTMSIGVAVLSACAEKTKLELVQRADQRLYEAKQGGRNRVCA